MTLSTLYRLALLTCCCSLALNAGEQQLQYEDPLGSETYSVAFDDRLISKSTLEQLLWFSPSLQFDIRNTPFETVGTWQGSTQATEKGVLLPRLNTCNPGFAECDHPTLNAAFLNNAKRNIDRGASEVEELKRMNVPPELDSVKQYFLRGMEITLMENRAQYAYLRTGNVDAMKTLLCSECKCGVSEQELIQSLRNANESKRLEISTSQWIDRMIRCEHDKPQSKYPLQDWQRFTDQFGIRERVRFHHVE